jgi:mRNA interferase RelE/StbE
VKILIDKSFDKDIDRIKDKKTLKRLRTLISEMKEAETIQDLKSLKKIEGHRYFYRVKIGDYRLGLEAPSSKEVSLIRFLHRKDIYRYFPKTQ